MSGDGNNSHDIIDITPTAPGTFSVIPAQSGKRIEVYGYSITSLNCQTYLFTIGGEPQQNLMGSLGSNNVHCCDFDRDSLFETSDDTQSVDITTYGEGFRSGRIFGTINWGYKDA